MILHCVFCQFDATAPEVARQEVLEDLRTFSLTLPGVLSFDFGPNRDFEQKSQEFAAGFVIRFASKEALEAYAVHPEHQRLGGALVSLCTNGAAGIVVYDLEVS